MSFLLGARSLFRGFHELSNFGGINDGISCLNLKWLILSRMSAFPPKSTTLEQNPRTPPDAHQQNVFLDKQHPLEALRLLVIEGILLYSCQPVIYSNS